MAKLEFAEPPTLVDLVIKYEHAEDLTVALADVLREAPVLNNLVAVDAVLRGVRLMPATPGANGANYVRLYSEGVLVLKSPADVLEMGMPLSCPAKFPVRFLGHGDVGAAPVALMFLVRYERGSQPGVS